MNPDSLHLLSRRERECLALVFVGNQSKAIASLLGLSPRTVDNYLSEAVRRVGASDRRAAAIAYAKAYPDEVRSVLEQSHVTALPLANEQLTVAAGGAEGDRALALRRLIAPPIPTPERQWNDLSKGQRISWSIAIAVGGLLVAWAVLSLSRHSLAAFATQF